MSILVLLFAVVAALIIMAWLLNRISCPFCKSRNIAPKENDASHGFATLFECLNPKCRKTFQCLPLIYYLRADKKENKNR